MKFYKKLIAVSKAVKYDVESRSKNKCEVIYNGINIRAIKKRTSIYNNRNINIILIGRLDHFLKGQDLLIEAAHYLVKKAGLINIKFYLAGEGPSRKFLQDKIFSLNLSENVYLLGNKDREWIYDNLHTYDLLIQPSRMEGFGLTAVEAMAAKVPVIASNIEGPAEILENGKYGLMFESDNFKDLVFQIERALKLYGNGEIVKLIDTAFEHCMANFNIEQTSEEYCNTYSKCLN